MSSVSNMEAGPDHVASDVTNFFDSELLHCFLGWHHVSPTSRSVDSKYKGCTDRLRWLLAACLHSERIVSTVLLLAIVMR